MPRRLLAVALLPPPPLRAHVDGLRLALGDPRLVDLPTHLTLVPPVTVAEDDLPALRDVLRRAVVASAPFELELGPAATFSPRTATLHLAVGGDREALARLRDALRVSPLDRPEDHPFVPHVTLLQRGSPSQVAAALELLRVPVGSWQVRSVTLLERLRPDSGPLWHPVAEEALGGPRVVGRGGVELHLRSGSVLEPAAAELGDGVPDGPLPAGEPALVTIAEEPGAPGAVIGAGWGRASAQGAVLDRVVVAAGRRRQGVGRQVVGEWSRAALDRGAGVVAVRPGASDTVVDASAFLESMGFRRIDPTTWCRRVGPVGELGSPP